MATPIGTNELTAISERHVLPSIQDMAYNTNALLFRLNAANKKVIAGGTQVEQPFMYSKFTTGGPYSGYEPLDVAPQDTIKNGAWDMKQHYVPVTIDGRTIALNAGPKSIASVIVTGLEQARIQMADNLGTGVYSDATTNPKEIDGLKGAIDAGSVTTTYAGLTRSTNTWLNSTVDASSGTLTLAFLRTLISSATIGGFTPTVLLGRKEQYNRLAALLVANQRFITQDEATTSAGFLNVAFENTPFIVDDKVFDGPNASNSAILALNENVIDIAIWGDNDFDLIDFQMPVNQDAYTARLQWYGNLIVRNPRVQAKATNVSA